VAWVLGGTVLGGTVVWRGQVAGTAVRTDAAPVLSSGRRAGFGGRSTGGSSPSGSRDAGATRRTVALTSWNRSGRRAVDRRCFLRCRAGARLRDATKPRIPWAWLDADSANGQCSQRYACCPGTYLAPRVRHRVTAEGHPVKNPMGRCGRDRCPESLLVPSRCPGPRARSRTT
jgi:hypothetical protein